MSISDLAEGKADEDPLSVNRMRRSTAESRNISSHVEDDKFKATQELRIGGTIERYFPSSTRPAPIPVVSGDGSVPGRQEKGKAGWNEIPELKSEQSNEMRDAQKLKGKVLPSHLLCFISCHW